MAQDFPNYLGPRDTLLGLPPQGSAELDANRYSIPAAEDHATLGVCVHNRVGAHTFEMLLDRNLRVESDLVERGDIDRSRLGNHRAATV